MSDQNDQTPTVVPVESTGRGMFGFGAKKPEEVQTDTSIGSDSAENVHVAEPEPKKEATGGGILSMFGFGAKKKEEVPSENAFSSEAPEKVEATEIEHESSGRDLIGTEEDGVKPGSAFSSEPVEKVQVSDDVDSTGHTPSSFISEPVQKVDYSDDTEPKVNLSDKESPMESTGRGLFGFGGKKAEEEVQSDKPYFASESDEKVHDSENVEPKHESLTDQAPVDSTDRGLFGFGGKKAEEVQSEKAYASEEVEPKHEGLTDQGPVDSTDRGLFGFGGKKAEEVRSENTFESESDQKVHISDDVEPKHESLLEKMHGSDQDRIDERTSDRDSFSSNKYEEKVPVSEPYRDVDSKVHFSEDVEPKHESLLEQMHRSDQERTDERTSDRDMTSSEYEQKVPVSEPYQPAESTDEAYISKYDEKVPVSEPYQATESTDRGLFGLGGKKKEEVESENAFNSEFEQKVQVSETKPQQKLYRSDSAPSSSSDEEEVEEGGVKKKKMKEKIMDKIKGNDKKPDETVYHQEATSIPGYSEVPLPVHQEAQPEEKKGFMEKMKDKLPGHKKTVTTNDEFAPAPIPVDHGPITPTEEKKSFLSKMKDKLHHSKTDEEKEAEKEKNQY